MDRNGQVSRREQNRPRSPNEPSREPKLGNWAENSAQGTIALRRHPPMRQWPECLDWPWKNCPFPTFRITPLFIPKFQGTGGFAVGKAVSARYAYKKPGIPDLSWLTNTIAAAANRCSPTS